MEIGEKLKEAREANSISLDSLQETTKIQKRYLIAIELGNLHILPGKFYARAFIKEYAIAVGLNPDELLEGHKDEVPTTEIEDNNVPYSRLQRSRRGEATGKSSAVLSVIPKIIVVLLVIGIIIVAYILYQKTMDGSLDPTDKQNEDEIIRKKDTDSVGTSEDDDADNNGASEDDDVDEESDESDPTDSEGNTNDNVNEEEEGETEQNLKLVDEGSGGTPESTFELINAGDRIELIFEPTGRSWLDVKNEQGETLLATNTEANTTIEVDVTGEESIRLNIGSAPNLPVIMINDIELEYPVEPSKFITQRIWINIKNE